MEIFSSPIQLKLNIGFTILAYKPTFYFYINESH